MNKNLYIVLMAGGVGSRFWPYSRSEKPKQFLDVLNTGQSLLQLTLHRFLPLCPIENIFVVTSKEHWSITHEQLPQLNSEQILSEPIRRNTAPCVAYAAKKIAKINPKAVLVVSPTDHLILQEDDFRETINHAVEQAQTHDNLITLGIHPTRPETGYGYIQYIADKSPLKKVKTFTEKPEESLAKKFIESGDFVWNSGIFVWGVQAINKAFAKHLPDMAEIFDEAAHTFNTPKERAGVEKAYSQTRSISIDYGILEKAQNVYVWLCHFPWSDLGSWNALFDYCERDNNNNVILANAKVYDTTDCIIRSNQNNLIVTQGLNGYLIGQFDNVVIVCQKDKEEFFRKVTSDLKASEDYSSYL